MFGHVWVARLFNANRLVTSIQDGWIWVHASQLVFIRPLSKTKRSRSICIPLRGRRKGMFIRKSAVGVMLRKEYFFPGNYRGVTLRGVIQPVIVTLRDIFSQWMHSLWLIPDPRRNWAQKTLKTWNANHSQINSTFVFVYYVFFCCIQ